MDDVRPIRTESDYAATLAEIRAFDDASYEPGTASTDRFDVLVTLVQAYERKACPMPDVDPIDVLNHAFSSMGHSQKELADLLGSASRASEVLSRKRLLTLEMIRTISAAWRIPVAALTGSYALSREYA